MKAILEKLPDVDAMNEFVARLEAWWDGREFDPDDIKEKPPAPVKPPTAVSRAPKPQPRIGALELIWGLGRYSPGGGVLDAVLIEKLGRQRGRIGRLGLIGTDAVTTDAVAEAFEEGVELAEWRKPCADRSRQVSESALVTDCDLDRLRVFEDGSLKGALTVEALSFVDHKPGVAARVYRALRDGGRWVHMDYVAVNGFKPMASFATAWAEPQLLEEDEVKSIIESAGFQNVVCEDVTRVLAQAARGAFNRIGAALDDAVAIAGGGREGALLLQELSWELTAWKARLKALENGGLRCCVWSSDKPGGAPAAAAPSAVSETEEDDWLTTEEAAVETEEAAVETEKAAAETGESGADEALSEEEAIAAEWEAVANEATDADAEPDDDKPAGDAAEEVEDLDQDAIDNLFD